MQENDLETIHPRVSHMTEIPVPRNRVLRRASMALLQQRGLLQ